MPYLEVKNLSYQVEDKVILDDISFRLDKGSILVIIGPNGSGKTSLLKNIISVYQPTAGEVKLAGKDIKQQLNKIAYVPQKFDFDRQTPITIREFMALARCHKASHSDEYISSYLAKVNLAGKEDYQLGTLSGGEFQRMMIARALLHEKELLILDEPASGIDLAGEETIYNLIAQVNKEQGITCLIVSHELNIVHRYASQVLCLNKSLVCYGPPQQAISDKTIAKLYGSDIGLYQHHKH